MREIEIKVKVDDLNQLHKNIEKSGIKLGHKLKKHDIVYALPGLEDSHQNY